MTDYQSGLTEIEIIDRGIHQAIKLDAPADMLISLKVCREDAERHIENQTNKEL